MSSACIGTEMRTTGRKWMIVIAVNAMLIAFVLYSALAPQAASRTLLMPGKTTHGHYQIQMRCDLCHTAGNGLKPDACTDCHAEELRRSKDTHPASKFNDPSNAELLTILDAKKCISCHAEHVEERTLAMGLTMPADYCYHCHQETLEARPSHAGFAFDSCATAGCHNYHDNRALYENFLTKHANEPDFRDELLTLARALTSAKPAAKLATQDADSPDWMMDDPLLINDWATTAHASAGVNCSGCHAGETSASAADVQDWTTEVTHVVCKNCHDRQAEAFLAGRHGMRLAQDLPAMTPGNARLSMHADAAHRQLDCSVCHGDHRFDTQFAAVDACLNCHNDPHSLAFTSTSHFQLWRDEMADSSIAGSGVSCATCHMPRTIGDDGKVWVQHNQNDNLRPNEKMIRDVCLDCHGLAFSIDALADRDLVNACFGNAPANHIKSIDLAQQRFEMKVRKRKARQPSKMTE